MQGRAPEAHQRARPTIHRDHGTRHESRFRAEQERDDGGDVLGLAHAPDGTWPPSASRVAFAVPYAGISSDACPADRMCTPQEVAAAFAYLAQTKPGS